MSGSHFDLKKIKRNWELAVTAEPSAPPKRVADVPSPADPFVSARLDFAKLSSLVIADLGREIDTVRPFLERVDRALTALESATAPVSRDSDATASEPADLAPLRDELDDALFDLEDLLEVLTLVKRS